VILYFLALVGACFLLSVIVVGVIKAIAYVGAVLPKMRITFRRREEDPNRFSGWRV